MPAAPLVAVTFDAPAPMSDRRLTRKLTALCLLAVAVVTIGLALAGVLQIRGPSAPVTHVVIK